MPKAPKAALKEPAFPFEYPEQSGITILRIERTKQGKVYPSYRVLLPADRAGGTRQTRAEFSKLPKAYKFAEDHHQGFQKHGEGFLALPAEARHEAVIAWGLLSKHGIGFVEAAKEALRVLRPEGGQRTVSQVIAELKGLKAERLKAGTLRQKTYADFTSKTGKIEEALGSEPVSALSPEAITAWLRRIAKEGHGAGKLGQRSLKNYRDALSGVLEFAKEMRYCAENPLERVSRQEKEALGGTRNEKAGINILTVEEADKLLRAAAAHDESRGLLISTALRLFCGLRTNEVCGLTWEHVRWQEDAPFVTVPQGVAKKRRIRNITLPANALEWIALCHVKSGPLVPGKAIPGQPATHAKAPEYCKKFRSLLKVAGMGSKDAKTGEWVSDWDNNDARHSFGSYHYALHDNEALTCKEMGHKPGEDVLFESYRHLVTKAQAERYFSLSPNKELAPVVPMEQATG